MDNNRIEEVVKTAMENLKGILSETTVMGTEVKAEGGDVLTPISKITFGVLSGGGEYGKIKMFSKDNKRPFSAGNGALVSVKPCAFLIKNKSGEYRMVAPESPIDFIAEKILSMCENAFKVKNED